MLTDRDIIVFGDDWGRYPSTMQHVARVLAKFNRLLWIGSLGLRKPMWQRSDIRRVWEKGLRMFPMTHTTLDSSGPICLHPVVIPLHDSKLFRRFNMLSLKWTIRRAMAARNIRRPIILSSSPWIARLFGKLGESSAHYLCLDDYTRFEGAFRSLQNAERDTIARADSCFFVSHGLLQTRGAGKKNSHYLPQGVDIEHFVCSSEPKEGAISSLQKPIVGFVGLLANWVDLGLLAGCARAYPEATFVIIGKATIDVSLLLTESNIVVLGEVSYERLPQYIRHFDVGLIPFLVNELTIVANPLKLLEYLAAGMSVVSTNLPEVARFKPLVHVAQDADEFIWLVGVAIHDTAPGARQLRMAKAREYSWETITEGISNVILETENRPAGSIQSSADQHRRQGAVAK